MDTNDIIPRWFQYKEECNLVVVTPNGGSTVVPVNIGMRRKGIAIAYSKQDIYLIYANNHILFQTEQNGTDWPNGGYTQELRRSLSGYYILIHKGDIRISRPGRDDDYVYNESIVGVFDEYGKEIDRLVGSPRYEKFAIGKYPIEMGSGLLYYEKSFYDVESLEIVFFIPEDFQVETIFKEGYCTLGNYSKNTNIIAKVKNSEIKDSFDVRCIERVLKTIKETGDLSIFKFIESDYPKDQIKYKFKQQVIDEFIEKLGSTKDYIKTNRGNYTNTKCISQNIYSREQFLEGRDLLSTADLKILNNIKNHLIEIYKESFEESLFFRFARLEKYIEKGIKAILFNDFFFLVCEGYSTYGHSGNFFYIFDYYGKRLSRSVYENIGYLQENMSDHSSLNTKIKFYNNMFTYAKEKSEEMGILKIVDGEVVETQYPNFMFSKEHWGYINMYTYTDFIKKDDHYYTYLGEEIPLHYVHVRDEVIIDNLELRPFPHFEYSTNHMGRVSDILPRVLEGKLCQPIEEELYECIDKVKKQNQELHKNISKIEQIGTYKRGTPDEYSLFYIEYRPKATCNTNGEITINADLGNVSFLKNIE